MNSDWKEYIVSTPDVLKGKPRIKGTRIPVSLILGYLAAGKTTEEIIDEFPDITKEQIAACLNYARRTHRGQVYTLDKTILHSHGRGQSPPFLFSARLYKSIKQFAPIFLILCYNFIK